MSGTIFISETDAWDASTAIFYGIAATTREAFPLEKKSLAEHIFAPDFPEHVEVFKFFSVVDLNRDDFNCFVQATKTAYRTFVGQHDEEDLASQRCAPFLARWGTLITQLEADSRYQPENSGQDCQK